MNKLELVASVAIKSELSKKDSEKAVVATFNAITEALANGEKVSVIGFGTFSVKDRAARIGRNPSTQETISIPAKQAPAFKAGKSLREAVKNQ